MDQENNKVNYYELSLGFLASRTECDNCGTWYHASREKCVSCGFKNDDVQESKFNQYLLP